jgi:Ca2+:H+ antiporter
MNWFSSSISSSTPSSSLGFVGSVKLLLVGEAGDRPWTNVLMIFFPFAVISKYVGWSPTAQFLLSLAALIPFAERLGFCTENLAEYTSDTLAGLMNASMGNAPELIIAIFALKADLIPITQKSLLGSILSNLMLVMGMSYIVGGYFHFELVHSTALSQTNALLLILLVAAHGFATIFSQTGAVFLNVLKLSYVSAIVLLILYLAYLVFQLKSHVSLFDDEEEEGELEDSTNAKLEDSTKAGFEDSTKAKFEDSTHAKFEDSTKAKFEDSAKAKFEDNPKPITPVVVVVSASGSDAERLPLLKSRNPQHPHEITSAIAIMTQDDDDDKLKLSFRGSIIGLAVVAGLIALLSELLTDSISKSAAQMGISEGFVATILTPIAGNAAEHWSAVTFAAKGRLNVSLGIAVGSSIQIGLFLIPVITLSAWASGKVMSYDYGVFEVSTLAFAVFLAIYASQHGKVQWLMGLILVSSYVIVITGYLLQNERKGTIVT